MRQLIKYTELECDKVMESVVKKNAVTILKITVLAMLMFGQLYRINYAIDTYYTFFTGFRWSADDMIIRNGRVVIALCYWLFDLTSLPNECFYYISYFMAMLFLVIAVWTYTGIINRYVKNENISLIVSFISIVNIFIIEYFMFLEKDPFMLGVFFNVIIVYFLQKFIDTGKNIFLIAMIVFDFLTILTYQGIICLYFILALPIVYKSSKNLWEYIKYIIMLCITYWIPVIVELLMFNIIFSSTRSGYDDSEAISDKIEYIKNIFIRTCTETFDIIPRNVFLIVVLLLVLISVVTIIHTANKKILNIINILIIIAACILLPMASIIGATGWDAPRIVYPLASIVGVLVINYYININELECKNMFNKCMKVLILVVLAFYTVIQYGGFINIINDRFESNYADRIRIQEIGQTIAEYEIESGNKVKYISFYRDANHDYPYYKDINDQSDLAISSFHNWDSQLNAINYYLGTNYRRSYGNKWYEDYFAQFDWHCYSPSQIECDGDTLHYCVY